jgi:hypothetical protein
LTYLWKIKFKILRIVPLSFSINDGYTVEYGSSTAKSLLEKTAGTCTRGSGRGFPDFFFLFCVTAEWKRWVQQVYAILPLLLVLRINMKGKLVRQSISIKKRRELENKIIEIFESNMESVPVGFRRILADDLVSAFESRVDALNQAQTGLQVMAISEGDVQVETVKIRNLY